MGPYKKEVVIHKSGRPMQKNDLLGFAKFQYDVNPKSRWKRMRCTYRYWQRRNHKLWNIRYRSYDTPDMIVLCNWYRSKTGYKHPERFCQDHPGDTIQRRFWAVTPEREIKFEWLQRDKKPKNRLFDLLLASIAFRWIEHGLLVYGIKRMLEVKAEGNGGGGCWMYSEMMYGATYDYEMKLWRNHFTERPEICAKIKKEYIVEYVTMIALQLFPEQLREEPKENEQLTLF